MMQVSVIVEIRELGPQDRPGRGAVGMARFKVKDLLQACDPLLDRGVRQAVRQAVTHALARRQEYLDELAAIAREQTKFPFHNAKR